MLRKENFLSIKEKKKKDNKYSILYSLKCSIELYIFCISLSLSLFIPIRSKYVITDTYSFSCRMTLSFNFLPLAMI